MSDAARRWPSLEISRFAGALSRIGWRARKQVPHVSQLEAADCGAACLAMVLGYHGREVSVDDVRAVLGTASGTNVLSIKQAASQLGLLGRGLSIPLDALSYLPPASILHWSFDHFVVLERVTARGAIIVDPAAGRRTVPRSELAKKFTGVAIAFEPGPHFERAAGRRSPYAALVERLLGERTLVGRALVTSLLLRVLSLGVPVLTGLVVDRVVPRGDLDLLALLAIALAAVVVLHAFSTILRSHLLLQLRTNLDVKMTLGLLAHLVSLPYGFFQRRSTGDLMMRVSSNSTIRELLTSNVLSALLDGPMVGLYLLGLVLLSPTLAAVATVSALLQVSLLVASGHRVRELMNEGLERQARAQSELVQILGGIQTLKLAGAESRSVEKWSHLFVDELNVSLRRARLAAWVDALQESIELSTPLVVLGVGALLVHDDHLSLGSMLAANALAIAVIRPVVGLVDSALQLEELRSYLARIDDLMSAPPEQDQNGVVHPGRLVGRIRLEQVSYRYGSDRPAVVDDVSLEIEPGSFVAIVGPSGCGKSTLAALMVGLHAPTAGRVLVDGRPLSELDYPSVRAQLGVVPQSPFVFSGTVRENLALGRPDADLARIVTAARRAQIHDDIVAMPMGYHAVVADHGANLSGGQRQRIAIARALLQRPAVLLLDEATSALDSRTEQRVMQSLAETGVTRIVIAHRLSTIVDADLILVMDRGSIVERGRHDELLANNGVYRALVDAQQGRPGGAE